MSVVKMNAILLILCDIIADWRVWLRLVGVGQKPSVGWLFGCEKVPLVEARVWGGGCSELVVLGSWF